MCPTFLRSVRPGFGTSDDLLSVYDEYLIPPWLRPTTCGSPPGGHFPLRVASRFSVVVSAILTLSDFHVE
jgi:hypothetical protein